MIKFYKFRQEFLAPTPGREITHKPGKGKGWPEECPPIRNANAFGFDLLANFDLECTFSRGEWSVKNPISVDSDFDWSANEETDGTPLTQDYAWFWEKGQKLPHVISDNVYEEIKHQVKVSTFLYLASDPNEVLLITDVPNVKRNFQAITALVETDWYPASYPWHCVLELDPAAKRVVIEKGEPLCRVLPVKRDTYFAKAMEVAEFDTFFERGQRWLQRHGKPHGHGEEASAAGAKSGTLDITRTYVRQQAKSNFVVME